MKPLPINEVQRQVRYTPLESEKSLFFLHCKKGAVERKRAV